MQVAVESRWFRMIFDFGRAQAADEYVVDGGSFDPAEGDVDAPFEGFGFGVSDV